MNTLVSRKSINNFLLPILILLNLMVPSATQAIYDPRDNNNNIHGIHILNTDEISKASELVNSSGGKWGYVTIPIQAIDRDKRKWESFMQKSRELSIIPILRITTIPFGGTWAAGELTDLVDFANFLNELPWPTENRYIIIFNEVNRSTEWGDTVNPEKYAHILKNSYTIFKERNDDFFILPAGLDLALSTTATSLNARVYFDRMRAEIPDIWSYIDGWNSHSYPNPNFASSPFKTGWTSIQGYLSELHYINRTNLPIFITETGWSRHELSVSTISRYFRSSYGIWSANPNIVAVTPFLLDARDGPFINFSLINQDSSESEIYTELKNLPKREGSPILAKSVAPQPYRSSATGSSLAPSFNKSFFLTLENFFRSIFNMPKLKIISVENREFTVELASSPEHLTQGLSGRKSLKENEGMLFVLPSHEIPRFWMKDMLIPLDIIWIRDSTVVDIDENVPTPDSGEIEIYSPDSPVNYVLEVNAGTAKRLGIGIGSTIDLLE